MSDADLGFCHFDHFGQAVVFLSSSTYLTLRLNITIKHKPLFIKFLSFLISSTTDDYQLNSLS